jgi:PAS domain S-box-containing protein
LLALLFFTGRRPPSARLAPPGQQVEQMAPRYECPREQVFQPLRAAAFAAPLARGVVMPLGCPGRATGPAPTDRVLAMVANRWAPARSPPRGRRGAATGGRGARLALCHRALPPHPPADCPITPARILVVEDDRVVARDLQQQLVRLGHTVVGVASRGDDAVRLVTTAAPELVLMDIRLDGGTDGIDAAREIRDRHPVPVIYLTAHTDDRTLERASATEPFGYLVKPFDDIQLRTAIEIALYKHRAERRLRASERRYAVTLSSIGDAVIATDEHLVVAFLNAAAEALTGWPRDQALGRPIDEVLPLVSAATGERIDHAGRGAPVAARALLVGRAGRAIAIEHTTSPIVDDGDATSGVVIVFRDLQRRQLEDAARRDTGIGSAAFDVAPALTPAQQDALSARLDAGELVTFDAVHRRRDGSVVPVEVRARRYREGERTAAAGDDLLAPRALLAACGDDPAILPGICATLRAHLPLELAAVVAALAAGDAPRLRDAAHELAGVVAALSSRMGEVASDVEDLAAADQLATAAPLVDRLVAAVPRLIAAIDGVSIDELRGRVI